MVFLQRCLEHAPSGASYLSKAYVLLVRSFHSLGRDEEALRHCAEGTGRLSVDVELLFEEGAILLNRGNLGEARSCFEKILALRTQRSYGGMDADLTTGRTRHNLGLVYRGLGLMGEAEMQLRAAVEEAPEFGPAWLGLVELLLVQRKTKEIDTLLARLQYQPRSASIMAALQARVVLARKDFHSAQQILEEALVRNPHSIWLRLFLCDMLLLVAKDAAAGEKHLRVILEDDPFHTHARLKLQKLLASQTKSLRS